jgi:DNA modification methylase
MRNVEILCSDSIEWMKSQPDEVFDLVVADPPYNLGKDYGNGSDSKNISDYSNFMETWIDEAIRLLKPSGTIYVFMGFRHISKTYEKLEKSGLLFINWLCWHYTQGLGKRRGFSSRHDDILVFAKSNNFKFNLDDIRVPQKYYRKINNMRGANPGDVWEFSHIHYCQENRQNHPTQKPEGLIERIVRASSDIGDMVLDPFLGSGTTARVCQQLSRNCVGIEVNPTYIEMAKSRLELPFSGFDSIDPRMRRVPIDLRDQITREEYVKNHIKWFLDKHENDVAAFIKEVEKLYGDCLSVSGDKRNSHKMIPSTSYAPS